MNKTKKYAIIGDDGEVCAFLRDTLIQDGHFARAFRLVKNGAGLVFVHQHDTDARWTDRQLLEWADHVVVVGAEVLEAVAAKIPVSAELPAADPQDESFAGGPPGNPFGRAGGSLPVPDAGTKTLVEPIDDACGTTHRSPAGTSPLDLLR